jgi:hypothetical protein
MTSPTLWRPHWTWKTKIDVFEETKVFNSSRVAVKLRELDRMMKVSWNGL